MIKRKLKGLINSIQTKINQQVVDSQDRLLLSNGEVLRMLNEHRFSQRLPFNDYEFKVFSQWGDDGLIHFLTKNLNLKNNFFVEFGVEDYTECNTRLLVESENWEGLILDGSEKNINALKSRKIYWQHTIHAQKAFVTKENIENILTENNVPKDLALLHIDIDGNDYWVWDAIENFTPSIVIVEYNSLFGSERTISVPYNKDFIRTNAHHSNLFYGASLSAFNQIAIRRNYAFVGCNNAGNNAYFVKKDLLNEKVKEVSIQQGFRRSKFRESRDKHGNLTFLSKNEGFNLIGGMTVVNVISGQEEKL